MRWFRWIHFGALVAVVCLVGVLSLSDSLVGPIADLMSIIGRLSRQLLSGDSFGAGRRPSLPLATDTLMHFGGWAGVGFVAGGLLAAAADRVNLALGLVTISAFFEAGQRYLTSSRSAELSDLVANGAGLTLGFVTFALVERAVATLWPDLGMRAEERLRRSQRIG